MMSVLGACWRRPILGESQGSFEGFKVVPENGERAVNRGKTSAKNRGKPMPRKSSYKVDKLLRVVEKWTNLILLGLGFL
jgi:hypothetical protein